MDRNRIKRCWISNRDVDMCSGGLNLLLNIFFVAGLGSGVAGVAIATVISQCFSAFVIFFVVQKDTGALRLDKLRPSRMSIFPARARRRLLD